MDKPTALPEVAEYFKNREMTEHRDLCKTGRFAKVSSISSRRSIFIKDNKISDLLRFLKKEYFKRFN
jgi:hypothetical protein